MQETKKSLSELALEILARQASIKGYQTPQQVIARMKRIIGNNRDYLDYRHRTHRDNSHDARVQEDNEVLALGIEMLAQAYGTLEE